ncbi:YfjI family protein [Accumulibacter sp.]|uniref:YfjI family protein n=1 Tax=Accumulibacter sp. TaxID=2053492 RepID=UPI002879D720|nr:YfjI family protein [Accumulibacter sp.]MDS4054983.1 YfjI family protein [Accumulibacter sp.]
MEENRGNAALRRYRRSASADFSAAQDGRPKSGIKTCAIELAELPWPVLVKRLRDYAEQPRADHLDALPALIYADFGDATTRTDKHVRAMSAAVLDLDSAVDLDATRTALDGLEHVLYTTKRSTPDAMRLRIVLPLVVPITAADWRGFYGQLLELLQIPGADACAEKLSQPFFVPPGGGLFEHGQGTWLDPAPLLAAAKQAAIDALPEPEPVGQHLPPVPPLDPKLIPAPLRAWVVDVAHCMQCPLDYCAVGALVALAGVVGASVGIRPKRKDDWLVVPNLWGGLIGPPSKKKTPALSEMLKALHRLEKSANDDTQHAKASAADPETKIKRKLLTQELTAALKAEREAERSNAAAEEYAAVKGKRAPNNSRKTDPRAATVIKLEMAELDAPPSGSLQARFRTNDATIEALHDLLSENARGMLVFRDELVGLLKGWEKQGHEQDRAFYLEAWNGHGSFPLDRIGRGHVVCDNMCVSILGGTQPDKVRGYLYQARQENDGLLQRFQLLVYPDTPPYAGMVDEYPDAAARETAFALFDTLARADFAALAETDPYGKIPHLRFAEDAQTLFAGWYDHLQGQKVEAPDEAPLIVEYLSKQPKTFAALALLFHLIERAEAIRQGHAPGPVSLAAAQRAAGWCAYLEAHARRIFALGQTLQSQAAGELARRIEAGALAGIESFTARDVYRKQWHLLNDAEIVGDALNELVEAGWLLRDAQATGWQQRGCMRYRVNPRTRHGNGLGPCIG